MHIEPLFDCFLGKEDFTHEKPAPEILYKAMDTLHAVQGETLIVGDSYKDVGAGKNAGITTVIFYPKDNELFYSPETVSSLGAGYIINNFKDLLTIIK